MKIRIASDLHTEFLKASQVDVLDTLVPRVEGEQDMVLVLAGDIVADIRAWSDSEALDIYTPWLKELAGRHRAIIYVGGNHEGYMSSFKTAFDYMNGLAESCENFHVLENDSVVVDDVKFLGTTKWTPLDGSHDNFYAQGMNDLRVISQFNVFKWRQNYQTARYFLETELPKEHDGPVVVITHHLPTYQSVHPRFHGSTYNACYFSREDDLIMEHKPTVWFHGHTHDSSDYVYEDYDGNPCTRVVCNPYGYHGHELNEGYDPVKVVEI